MSRDKHHGGSPSIEQPDYWWYRARSELLRVALERYVGSPGRILDVGSADGPSVGWLRGRGQHVSLDLDPRGLASGGVCGSVFHLPFADGVFDVVTAFDVVEHCDPEHAALDELHRVLAPGGRLLLSVPAYQWAWTGFDEENGHHRRYTRSRARHAVEQPGLVVDRATYAFMSVFPAFTAERLVRKVRERREGGGAQAPADVVGVPAVSPRIEQLLLRLTRVDERLLRGRDLPFGSSVFVAATKPAAAEPVAATV
jgi:SAM-dependent methyltransferase